MIKVFKAGDFTSGKMSEIFKECFFKDIAHINHKQFGDAYLIPSETLRVLAIELFSKTKKGREFMVHAGNDDSGQGFLQLHEEDQLHHIDDFFHEGIEDWLTAITYIISSTPRTPRLKKD
jgi:hypothetical protein